MSEPIPPQILHVDDDPEVLDLVREFLEGETIDGWGRPQVVSEQSFEDALMTLELRRFDLMILDVRLGGHGEQDLSPDEEEGVRTLQAIKERRFLPIVFWTGLPEKVRHLKGPLVRVHEKTEGSEVLLAAIRELFGTRLPSVNRALRHLVEDQQRRYMWEFAAKHWDELTRDGDAVGLAHLLVRRLGESFSGPGIDQVARELGADGPSAPADGTVQAAAMYIVPPLPGTEPSAADLFREGSGDGGETWWLTVTPSCDFVHGKKVEFVVLARCRPAVDEPRVRAWRTSLDETGEENAGKLNKVRELVKHNTGGQHDRWLFLPAAPTIPDLVVDFQQLRSIGRRELDAMVRVASLSSPFAESAINRFTRYFGRIGTDDLDHDAIIGRLRHLQLPAPDPSQNPPES